MDNWSIQVFMWWMALCCFAVVNPVIWLWSLKKPLLKPKRILQRWLSLVYVLGCGFRSVFPREDVGKMVLFDTPISSVVIGRSVATVAELCFMLQLALYLRELARDNHVRPAFHISRVLFPAIVSAEICSWYAVITTNFLGNVCEQSIWTLAGGLLTLSCFLLLPGASKELRRWLLAAISMGAAYVTFMLTVDVPMYLSRWRADEAAHKVYPPLAEGFHDLCSHWVVTRAYADWKPEMMWMTLYFSAAVWLSISLTHAAPARRS